MSDITPPTALPKGWFALRFGCCVWFMILVSCVRTHGDIKGMGCPGPLVKPCRGVHKKTPHIEITARATREKNSIEHKNAPTGEEFASGNDGARLHARRGGQCSARSEKRQRPLCICDCRDWHSCIVKHSCCRDHTPQERKKKKQHNNAPTDETLT